MKKLFQTLLFLVLIYLALAGAAFLFIKADILSMDFSIFAIINTGALIISTIVSIVFFAGIRKNEKNKIIYSFSAFGLKFLLFLAFIGIMALTLKNPDEEFIITFFVVYLTFTFYLLLRIVKILKSN